MPDTGFLSGDAATNRDTGFSLPWTNPTEGLVNDGVMTFNAGNLSQTETDWLVISDFDVAISADSIVGIEVEVEYALGVDGEVLDGDVFLTKDGTNIAGSQKSLTATGGVFETNVFGGPTDLWGASWSEADVESAAFGACLGVLIGTGGGSFTIDVDIVRVKIYYNQAWTPESDSTFKQRVVQPGYRRF